jgi:hypothetical protein
MQVRFAAASSACCSGRPESLAESRPANWTNGRDNLPASARSTADGGVSCLARSLHSLRSLATLSAACQLSFSAIGRLPCELAKTRSLFSISLGGSLGAKCHYMAAAAVAAEAEARFPSGGGGGEGSRGGRRLLSSREWPRLAALDAPGSQPSGAESSRRFVFISLEPNVLSKH